MKLDQNPVFRKIIVPWYDSGPVCWGVIFVMVAVFLFGISGVGVTRDNPEYRNHIWVPLVLILLSGIVAVATFLRLTRRYLHRTASARQESYSGLHHDS